MKVVFLSLTGQTRRFVQKLELPTVEITPQNVFLTMDESYIIISPTYDMEVFEYFQDFIETGNNQALLKGVAGSGNRNFNTSFCQTAKIISTTYDVPLLHCFEFHGTQKDVTIIKEKVRELG